jgi:hypothetical protein
MTRENLYMFSADAIVLSILDSSLAVPTDPEPSDMEGDFVYHTLCKSLFLLSFHCTNFRYVLLLTFIAPCSFLR